MESAICRSTYLISSSGSAQCGDADRSPRLGGRDCGTSDRRNQSTPQDRRPGRYAPMQAVRLAAPFNCARGSATEGWNARGCSPERPERPAGAQATTFDDVDLHASLAGAVQHIDGLFVDDELTPVLIHASLAGVRHPPSQRALDRTGLTLYGAGPPAGGGNSTSGVAGQLVGTDGSYPDRPRITVPAGPSRCEFVQSSGCNCRCPHGGSGAQAVGFLTCRLSFGGLRYRCRTPRARLHVRASRAHAMLASPSKRA